MRDYLAVQQPAPQPVLQAQNTETVHPAFPRVKMLLGELVLWCGGDVATVPNATVTYILSNRQIEGCVHKLASTFIDTYIPERNKLKPWLQELRDTETKTDTRFKENRKIMNHIKELLKTLAKEIEEKIDDLDHMAYAFVHQFIEEHQCECTWLKYLVDTCGLFTDLSSAPSWWFQRLPRTGHLEGSIV